LASIATSRVTFESRDIIFNFLKERAAPQRGGFLSPFLLREPMFDRLMRQAFACIFAKREMSETKSQGNKRPEGMEILLPDIPALAVAPGQAAQVTADGEIETLAPDRAGASFARRRYILCHTVFSARRLGFEGQVPLNWHFDVLELFAFVKPAAFCLPTPTGLADALRLRALGAPNLDLEDQALLLFQAAEVLLVSLKSPRYPHRSEAKRTALALKANGWPWAEAVIEALGSDSSEETSSTGRGLDVWNLLEDWEEGASTGEPGTDIVSEDEARLRLREILGERREPRLAQSDFAAASAAAFAPRAQIGAPNMVLAEAGTGIGKTAGYIAPASVWAQKNGPSVWISTYTKNLQRQIDQELTFLYPDPAEKAAKVVIRKGRENYLCLLNLQEAATGGSATGNRGARPSTLRKGPGLGLIARWARYSRDGDMVGGDFPAWLTPIVTENPNRTEPQGIQAAGLTDRRGECIYSACPHYKKCFIERAIRKSRKAEIVIANHALIMNRAAQNVPGVKPRGNKMNDHERADESDGPGIAHYIFDEGHHLFDAADSNFGSHLNGFEAQELRRWLRGPEGGRRGSRGRGLIDRVGDITGESKATEEALQHAVQAASALAGPGFMNRITEGAAQGPYEKFLQAVFTQVLARSKEPNSHFDIECPVRPFDDALLEKAEALAKALTDLTAPMKALMRGLGNRLDDEAETLDTSSRIRIEAAIRGLKLRAEMMLPSWISMASNLHEETPKEFVDWFGVERNYGRNFDTGMYRHWIDPTVPLAATVFEPAQGVLITSATLRDRLPEAKEDSADPEEHWSSAEVRTGVGHLALPAHRAHFSSPFDYPKQTRILVVNDIARTNADQVASAYRELMKASGGGALGVFTAIGRLRAVHERIIEPLQAEGLPLYAQHVDAMDTGTLVDLFRAEEDACLLGTDSVRDGVDVPGRSLRLIVFDRVPWPRPSLLHKARRKAFEGKYDDMITRLRLKQAFGRLIRQQDDKGLFVMLDARMPSRLATAFPEGVEIERVGLAEAISTTRGFLSEDKT
jgi:ATP-dependent DNA helicase DinG